MSHSSFTTQNAADIRAYLNSGEFDGAPYTDSAAVKGKLTLADATRHGNVPSASIILLTDSETFTVSVRRLGNSYKVTTYYAEA